MIGRGRWSAPLLIGPGAPAVHAAAATATDDWLPWIIVGAIVLFVVGVVLRMILATRFPKGYRNWAAQRRGDFEANNEAWDRADEEFRR